MHLRSWTWTRTEPVRFEWDIDELQLFAPNPLDRVGAARCAQLCLGIMVVAGGVDPGGARPEGWLAMAVLQPGSPPPATTGG